MFQAFLQMCALSVKTACVLNGLPALHKPLSVSAHMPVSVHREPDNYLFGIGGYLGSLV